MKKESIKTKLMKEFELNDEQVECLIKASTKDKNGKIDLKQIEADIKKIANTIIFKAGSVGEAYTIRHELLSCGKSRQYDMMMELLKSNSETQKIAEGYLSKFYSTDVDSWVYTFYNAARCKLDSILKKDIDSYREFVKELPNKDVGLVARVFDKEKEFAEYLAKNGDNKDFLKFMSRKNKKGEKVYPRKLSNKVFDELKKEVSNGSFKRFSIDDLLYTLPKVHNLKDLSKEQVEHLETKFIQKNLESKAFGYDFAKLLNYDFDSKFEALDEYLDKEEYFDRVNYLIKIIEPVYKNDMEKAYSELLSKMEELLKEGNLNCNKFCELISKSEISQNGKKDVILSEDEKTNKDKVILYKDIDIIKRQISVSLDGTRIKEIMDLLNKEEKEKAFARLEEISEKGIPEMQIYNIYDCDYGYRRMIENREGNNLFGIIKNQEKNSGAEYIVGGKLDSDEKLTDLVVKKDYNVIKNLNYVQSQALPMNEEQIKRFNGLDEKVDSKEHYYTYGRIDGYYQRKVNDFKVCDKETHIKNGDWTNGGWYTLLWTEEKEDEKDYPNEAMGLSSSRSEWARYQRGVDNKFVMKLINKNPRRFLKLLEKAKGYSDCCGLYPTAHIEDFYKELLSLPTESELEIESIMNKSEKAEELKEKESKAKELLEKCENLQKKNSLED